MADFDLQAERATYEAWVTQLAPEQGLARKEDGSFADYHHESCFEVWIAARRAAPSSPVGDDGLPEPWEARSSQYETESFSKEERMEAEIAEWRAWAAHRTGSTQ